MRYAYALLALSALALAALAEPPELKLTPSIPKPVAGDLVRVTADAPGVVKWRVVGDWQTVPDSNGKSILVVCKSSRLDVFAVTFTPGEKGEISDIVMLTFNGGGAGPTPGPPGPPVVPVTPSKLFVVIVEETSDAAAGRGAMFADAALSARMKDKGHVWRVVDKDVVGPDRKTPPADVKRFLDAAAGKALPQISLVDDAGVTRFTGDWGKKTAADLIALLAQWGG